MIEEVKKIIENYINNRQMACIVSGRYENGKVFLNEKAYIPNSLLIGSNKSALKEGDTVNLLRNDRGREYYILEIINAPAMLKREEQ